MTGAGGRVEAAQYFTPSLAIFGLSFGCYTSLVFAIPRARERGILKRVRGTPVEPSVYLGSLIVVGASLGDWLGADADRGRGGGVRRAAVSRRWFPRRS